jgi:hypothetical protein
MTMAHHKMGGLLAAALPILVACDRSPAAPGPIDGSPPPFRGEITISEIVPGPGATVTMRDCGRSQWCTDQFQTTFNVLMPSDVQEAWVIVSLERGSMPCAAAFFRTALTANTRASFSASSIAMQWDEGGHLLCSLPVETTRLVFSVFRDGVPASALLSQEMPYRLILSAASADAK